MTLNQLSPALGKATVEIPAQYYSEGLRLRPNYLIYTTTQESLTGEQTLYLKDKEIPWAEYLSCNPLLALRSFLKSVEGGLYMPKLHEDLLLKCEKLYLFLLDPHLIEEFESLLTPLRRGVLIRRPILASADFQDVIEL